MIGSKAVRPIFLLGINMECGWDRKLCNRRFVQLNQVHPMEAITTQIIIVVIIIIVKEI